MISQKRTLLHPFVPFAEKGEERKKEVRIIFMVSSTSSEKMKGKRRRGGKKERDLGDSLYTKEMGLIYWRKEKKRKKKREPRAPMGGGLYPLMGKRGGGREI